MFIGGWLGWWLGVTMMSKQEAILSFLQSYNNLNISLKIYYINLKLILIKS